MSVALLALLSVLLFFGIAVVMAGITVMQNSRAAIPAAPRPPVEPPVEHTDEHGRKRVIHRAVYLSLELARVDGAIADVEMRAIEDYLSEHIVDMDRDEAEQMVHKALRATIRQTEDAEAIKEIAHLADAIHRKFVMEMLTAVARADGVINEPETAFIQGVADKLNVSWKP